MRTKHSSTAAFVLSLFLPIILIGISYCFSQVYYSHYYPDQDGQSLCTELYQDDVVATRSNFIDDVFAESLGEGQYLKEVVRFSDQFSVITALQCKDLHPSEGPPTV